MVVLTPRLVHRPNHSATEHIFATFVCGVVCICLITFDTSLPIPQVRNQSNHTSWEVERWTTPSINEVWVRWICNKWLENITDVNSGDTVCCPLLRQTWWYISYTTQRRSLRTAFQGLPFINLVGDLVEGSHSAPLNWSVSEVHFIRQPREY